MDGSSYWIIAIIAAIGIVLVLVFLVEWNTPSPPTDSSSQNNPRLAQRYESCANLSCGPGLICTSSSNRSDPICLSDLNQPCLVDADCASGTCYSTSGTTGVCRASAPSSGTRIYCYRSNEWIPRLTIPNGLVFNRISPAGGRLLGISTSTNQVYLWSDSSWIAISTMITPPGQLIDGTMTEGFIWLVYQLPSGQTAVYQVINNSLIPYTTSNGGVQKDSTGQPILITSIAVSADGTIFLIGSTSGSQSMLYRKSINETSYTPITLATGVYVRPGANGSDFAFSSGSSILSMGSSQSRQDGIPGQLITFVVTPDNDIWYLTNNQGTYQLYRNGGIVVAPTPLSGSSRLYYSLVDGVCLYTPSY